MRLSTLTLVIALAMITARPLLAAVPDWQGQMNYQGQLTDPIGLAVADGAYLVTFKLYDHPSSLLAMDLIWPGETQSLTVRRGLFNAYLGQIVPLPQLTAAQMGSDYYLSVQVAGELTEMLPRQKLLPAFFARSALNLQGLYPGNTANDLVVLDASGRIPAGTLSGVSVTNNCASCHAGIFTNITASAADTGAALRIGGRIAAPDIVNTFVASIGVTSQVVTCPYCKAGDEVFLQPKGDIGNNRRFWVTSVGNGSFTIGFDSGLNSAVSMAYLVVGDF